MEQSAILLFQKAITDMISENQEYINQTILSTEQLYFLPCLFLTF